MELNKRSVIIIVAVIFVIIAAVVALVLFGGNGASIEPVADEGESGEGEVVVEPTKVEGSVEFTFSPAAVELSENTECKVKLYVQFVGEVPDDKVTFVHGNEKELSTDKPFDIVVALIDATECSATVPLSAGAVASKEYDISILALNVGTQTVTVSCGEFSADLSITVNEGAVSSSSGGNGGGSNGGGSGGGYSYGDGSTWVYDDSGCEGVITIGGAGEIDPTASM